MYPHDVDQSLVKEFADHRARDLGALVQILLAPLNEAQTSRVRQAKTPERWLHALSRESAREALSDIGWDSMAEALPSTVDALRNRLAGLGLLLARGEPPSLLYFFVIDDEVTAFEGLLPVAKKRSRGEAVPADLQAMQAVHDGWFDFYSGELGPLPEEEWETLGDEGEAFIAVATKGSAMAGFEAGTLVPHVLWPEDQEVETPTSLFTVIDEWVSLSLEPE